MPCTSTVTNDNQMTVESNYAIATLNDKFKNLSPAFQPMRSKPKTNHNLIPIFPCFEQVQEIAQNSDWFKNDCANNLKRVCMSTCGSCVKRLHLQGRWALTESPLSFKINGHLLLPFFIAKLVHKLSASEYT